MVNCVPLSCFLFIYLLPILPTFDSSYPGFFQYYMLKFLQIYGF